MEIEQVALMGEVYKIVFNAIGFKGITLEQVESVLKEVLKDVEILKNKNASRMPFKVPIID